jgi:CheY-like chemotaxis protein
MMDSEIQVQSTLGLGSKFTFVVRFEKAEHDGPEIIAAISKENAHELLAGCRILLVEDNETNLQVAQELLEQVGVEVVAAANGMEAVRLATKERFDGILMDLQMPVMDGLAATREIRIGSAPPDLPILAMTANATVGDRERCLAAGMNDHIAKPIKPEVLYTMLVRRLRPDVDLNSHLNMGKIPELVSLEGNSDWTQLEGIDVLAGLVSVNNDRKLYRKLLYHFHSRHRDIKTEIQKELERGNFSDAQRLAHTIKGVAGTIGAKKLSEISSHLESAIKDEDSDRISNLMDPFAKEVMRIMTTLDVYTKRERTARTETAIDKATFETQPKEVLETHSLKKLFQELSTLIDERDSDAIKVAAKIKKLLGPSNISNNFQNLESQINSFKFEQAKEALEQATKDLDH